MINFLNLRVKTIKLIKENGEINPHDIIWQWILKYDTKSKHNKRKHDKLNFIKVKNVCTSKRKKATKWKLTEEWKKIFPFWKRDRGRRKDFPPQVTGQKWFMHPFLKNSLKESKGNIMADQWKVTQRQEETSQSCFKKTGTMYLNKIKIC